MIDGFAKEYLHGELRWVRGVMVWKVEGLGEYEVRRPMTVTGTNLLGLIKHLAIWEARYFGEVFGRPFAGALPGWGEAGEAGEDGSDLWATEEETREEIIEGYRGVWEHSDATINDLDIDAPGFVPWWPLPDVKLFTILVHMLTETHRHAGHADILREQLDGRTGTAAEEANAPERDAAFWDDHRAKVERAARAASGGGYWR